MKVHAIPLDWRFRGLLVFLGLLALLPGLGEFVLSRFDEALYANGANNMLQHGQWLIPHVQVNFSGFDYALTPRLAKPPLAYWLEALSMVVFDITPFAARLPSALAAIATALLVYDIGRKIFERWTGIAGGLVLLVLPPVYHFIHGGRTAEPDMLLALFGSLFVWWTLRSRLDARLLLPAGVAAGLAVLTKGFGAGIFLIIVLPVVISSFRTFWTCWTGYAVALTTLIAVPWHLYAWLTYPDQFYQQFVATGVLRRMAGELSTSDALFPFMNHPYFTDFPAYLHGFSILLLAGTALLCYEVYRDGIRDHGPALFLLWWTVSIPIAFAILGGNHRWYLLPVVVPVAVLIGRVSSVLWRRGIARLTTFSPSASQWILYVGLGCLVVFALVLAYPPRFASPTDIEQRELATAIDASAPPDATVALLYPAEARPKSVLLSPFSFYVQRPVEIRRFDRAKDPPETRYALVARDHLDYLSYEYEELEAGSTTGLVAIRLSDENGQVSR